MTDNPATSHKVKLQGSVELLKRQCSLYRELDSQIDLDVSIPPTQWKTDVDLIKTILDHVSLYSDCKTREEIETLTIKFLAKKINSALNDPEQKNVHNIIEMLYRRGLVKRPTVWRTLKKGLYDFGCVLLRLVIG